MKSGLIAKVAILTVAISSALSLGALAQTTDEGPGPSEQPSAPMEVGQAQPDYSESSAQPSEAEPGGPSGETPAQTDQGVGRISLIHGDVSTQRGDADDWSAATLNQPLMTGDKISTADNARTEIQLDFANTLRLGRNTKANIANLTHKNIQIQIGEGIANYTVSKDSESEPEITTPNVSLHPSHHDGVFRIEVHPDGDTIVIVRKGEAQIATPQGSTEVRAGEMATVRGDANSAEYKITSASDRDDWDRWNGDRDHVIQDASSWRHTNRRYTGTHDLDGYGHWRNVPDYGDVWYPDEPSDWVPYRNGNWVWEPYYGWTWVGYEPWGWAPYHYGRWMSYGGAWGWWPGPVYAGYNPFWAPAYVSFWGWGGGWGFNVGWGGWGGFGWLPLGPCDRFHPWWGGYRGRFGVVNVTNVHITNINNPRWGGIGPLHGGTRFSNLNNIHDHHVMRAMSVVNAGHFGAGRMRPMPATREQLNGARLMAGNLPVVPTRASLSASGRAAAPSTIRNGGSQRFFGTHNNMARPVSFQQQTASLRQTMQQSHVGAIPAGGRNASQFAAHNGNSMQRPSAGIPANREVSNFGGRTASSREPVPATNTRGGFGPPTGNTNANRSVTSPRGTTSQPVDRGGSRTFTPPSGNTRSTEQGNRTLSPSAESPRGTSQAAPVENRGGFRTFTPPTNNTRPSEGGNMRDTSRGTNQPAPTQNRDGFRPFNPPTSNTRPSEPANMGSRGVTQSAPVENRGGFRPFTPPSSSGSSRGAYSAPTPRGNTGSYAPSPRGNTGSYAPSPRSNTGSYWNRTAPSSVGQPRNYGSNSGSYGGASSRPQLDMRQPIVRGPSYGGSVPRGGYNSSPYGGGSRGAPSYGGGSHSAPNYGGSRSSAPSYGGGGGHAPSGGGGGGRTYGGGGGGGHVSGGGGGGGHASSGNNGHSGRR
jgi:hypothetical protein